MPPKGLYSVPRSYLYGGHNQRLTLFNSNEYEDEGISHAEGGLPLTSNNTENRSQVEKVDKSQTHTGHSKATNIHRDPETPFAPIAPPKLKREKKRKRISELAVLMGSSEKRTNTGKGLKKRSSSSRKNEYTSTARQDMIGRSPVELKSISREVGLSRKDNGKSGRGMVVEALPRTPRKTPVPPPRLDSVSSISPDQTKEIGNTKDRNLQSAYTVKSSQQPSVFQKTPVPLSILGYIPSAMTATKNKHEGLTSGVSPASPQLTQRGKISSRANSIASVGTSFPDSDSSSSDVLELFPRVGMPYDRSGTSYDPFVKPEKRNMRRKETHEEAEMHVFQGHFIDLQKAVNFTEEQSYLKEYYQWNQENSRSDPLPCLKKATGCTSKQEKILQFSREKNPGVVGFVEAGGGDQNKLIEADQRAHEAEGFLIQAIHARVPIPIGPIEGQWSLYCPRYSVDHFDRYGFGSRTLFISTIAGLGNSNQFTARLNIPPRSMPYAISTFSVPPHASFRTTTLSTALERYKMDVIFLGNGYLHMRIDLNLLLRGKDSELVEGKKFYMEFIGIHQKATAWVEEVDEIEEEGRRLFAKYGDVEED
ncbi:hypothetical protein BS50DRAFT_636107 [Corynespora cassiicola Philippines]|uniref:Uncharacterized protein n=1 Tax=Corynespora cassiicola Philippines TaxID=1448308 RepID=A0A2T2NIR0_CORCC|nr:hypothetical protein BS50DRAFT_636107 [Corynespora cassiicola Philippines]